MQYVRMFATSGQILKILEAVLSWHFCESNSIQCIRRGGGDGGGSSSGGSSSSSSGGGCLSFLFIMKLHIVTITFTVYVAWNSNSSDELIIVLVLTFQVIVVIVVHLVLRHMEDYFISIQYLLTVKYMFPRCFQICLL